ncbi:MAG: hypothetical protein GY851_19245 [bacterium]|nr:hypothetical protein [bacterium]
MSEYELEDTNEIAVADHPIGKVLLLISALLAAICIVYFATQLTRPEPTPESAGNEVVSSPAP